MIVVRGLLVLGCAISFIACGVAGTGPDAAELQALRVGPVGSTGACEVPVGLTPTVAQPATSRVRANAMHCDRGRIRCLNIHFGVVRID